jgi:N-acetyl-gamma-glutamyl-phosphate/LysW-gamma-L-alpha-aminoadipyl-6-phosphate reductase
MTAQVAIFGATGYGGAELLRNLLVHPHVNVARAVAIDHVGEPLGTIHPTLAGTTDLVIEKMSARDAARGMDAIFFALPHKTSAEIIMELFDQDVRILDLSGDFRLQNPEDYTRFYSAGHPCPEASASFVYGLPELQRDAIRGARRIASPGCFATNITLGLLPAARAGWLNGPAKVVAMTGSSGSGAQARPTTHHPLRARNLRTYLPLTHQHAPEIEQTLRSAGALGDFALQFVPVSAPLVRGIFSTAFIDVPEAVEESAIEAAFQECYADEPFVRVVQDRKPEVNAVAGSMFAEVGWHLDEHARDGRRTLVCFSALDNLVKGGAGQAVQSFNVMMGWPDTTGIDRPALWP